MLTFTAPAPVEDPVTISCYAPPDVKTMRVIGDFNRWDAPGEKMQLSADGLHWELKVSLEPGVYRYVFIANSKTVPLGETFRKNVQTLVLTPSDYSVYPAIKGDGLITKTGVSHVCNSQYVTRLNPFTYQLRLRTRKDDVDQESVAVWTDGGEQKNYPLHWEASDPLFDYYTVKVVVNANKSFNYRFLLDDGHGTRSYDLDGLSDGILGGKPFSISPSSFRALELPGGLKAAVRPNVSPPNRQNQSN